MMYICAMENKNPGNRTPRRGHRSPEYDVAQKVISFRFPAFLINFCRSIGSAKVREIIEKAQKEQI